MAPNTAGHHWSPVEVAGHRSFTVRAYNSIRASIPYGPETSPSELASGVSAQDRGLLFGMSFLHRSILDVSLNLRRSRISIRHR